MRVPPTVALLGLAVLPLTACGGGGGSGGPLPAPSVFGFAAGPTTTIVPSVAHTPPLKLVDLELADHDADGSVDLGWAATTAFLNIYAVETNPGLGNGAFGAVLPASPYISGEPPLLAVGDVLGAGRQGFALGNLQSLAVSTGVFTTRVSTIGFRTVGPTTSQVGGTDYVSALLRGVAVGDLNGDLIDDVAIADGQNNRIVTWLSIGTSGLGQAVPTLLPQGQTPFGVAAGDWEGDGDDDLIVVLAGTGYVTFTGPSAGTVVPFGSGQIMLNPVTGDFDGDGTVDVAGLLVGNAPPLGLGFLRGLGNGTFAALVLTTPVEVTLDTVNLPQIHAGDLDGDGRSDLALVIPAADRACVFLGTATGAFTFFADADLEGGGSDTLGMGDVDNDGDLDLVIGNATTLVVRTLLNERL